MRRKFSLPKLSYTPKYRKLFYNLNKTAESKNGYVKYKVLYLPIEYKNNPEITAADLIIIQDIKGFNTYFLDKYKNDDHSWDIDKNLLLAIRHLGSPKSFEIFKISRNTEESINLSIDYTSNDLTIGIPKRADHKFMN